MTRVDFYVLSDSTNYSIAVLACKLTEKAFKQGHRVFIQTDDYQHSDTIDKLLWSFREGSFIPHGKCPLDDHKLTPVVVGHECDSDQDPDILINLSKNVPPSFARFQRLMELVGNQTAEKNSARERFRFYRERGYPLQTHNL